MHSLLAHSAGHTCRVHLDAGMGTWLPRGMLESTDRLGVEPSSPDARIGMRRNGNHHEDVCTNNLSECSWLRTDIDPRNGRNDTLAAYSPIRIDTLLFSSHGLRNRIATDNVLVRQSTIDAASSGSQQAPGTSCWPFNSQLDLRTVVLNPQFALFRTSQSHYNVMY